MNPQMLMSMIQNIKNPQKMLQNMGIPQEAINTPQDVANYLLNNGKVNQSQIDQAKSMYQQIFGGAQR